jgi:hypothetical protein
MTEKTFPDPNENKVDFTTAELFWPTAKQLIDNLKITVFDYVPIAESNISFANDNNNFSVSGDLSNIQSERTGKYAKSLATIVLPIPPSINYSDSLSWSDDKVGAIGKLLPSIAKSASGGNAEQLGSSIQTLAKQGLSGMIASALNSAGINSDALTQGIGGKVLNPYREQIFGGIGMREFTFQWKLVPRNKAEQKRIHNIIKVLRYFALPNYSGQTVFESTRTDALIDESAFNELSDRWLTVPKIFDLQWTYFDKDEIKSLPKIKPCVLKNVTINYTPDGVWATHYFPETELQGPVPVAYELTLQFGETEIVTGSDVIGGF